MNATMKILLRSVLISIWFVVLTFPVLCVKVAARQNTVTVLWERAVGMFVVMIVCSLLWLWYFHRKEQGADAGTSAVRRAFAGLSETWRGMTSRRSVSVSGLGLLLAVGLLLPLVGSMYQTTIFANAFLYVMLALGLNIAVGIAGQLVLGYAAFYAIGAYTYGLLNQYFGLGFWVCLPLGGLPLLPACCSDFPSCVCKATIWPLSRSVSGKLSACCSPTFGTSPAVPKAWPVFPGLPSSWSCRRNSP